MCAIPFPWTKPQLEGNQEISLSIAFLSQTKKLIYKALMFWFLLLWFGSSVELTCLWVFWTLFCDSVIPPSSMSLWKLIFIVVFSFLFVCLFSKWKKLKKKSTQKNCLIKNLQNESYLFNQKFRTQASILYKLMNSSHLSISFISICFLKQRHALVLLISETNPGDQSETSRTT